MSDGQARVADSISHYDVLQSSGQLTQLRQTVARMMQMNASYIVTDPNGNLQ